jgi:hypothetical protein
MSDEIEIKTGIPIPPPSAHGRRGPITVAMGKMQVGNCIDLPPPENPKVRSDMYVRAKTAGIKITMRTVHENGAAVLRIWRTG